MVVVFVVGVCGQIIKYSSACGAVVVAVARLICFEGCGEFLNCS